MKLKELKCPNCNAKLNIKPIDTTGICPYCNSEFILDDEVIKVISDAKAKLSGKLTKPLFNQETDTRGHFNKEIM